MSSLNTTCLPFNGVKVLPEMNFDRDTHNIVNSYRELILFYLSIYMFLNFLKKVDIVETNW